MMFGINRLSSKSTVFGLLWYILPAEWSRAPVITSCEHGDVGSGPSPANIQI